MTRIASIYFAWQGSERRHVLQECQFDGDNGDVDHDDLNNTNNLDAAVRYIRGFLLRERNCIIVN